MSGFYLAQTEHNLNSRTALDCTFTLGNSVCVKNFIMGHGKVKTETGLLCVWHINCLGAAMHKFIYSTQSREPVGEWGNRSLSVSVNFKKPF